MYCTKCGTELPDEANFCSKCGTPVTEVGDTDIQAQTKDQSPELTSPKEKKLQTHEVSQSWLISNPGVNIFVWLVVIGSVAAIILGPDSPQNGLNLCFWSGIIAAITAKRKGRSGLLWFFIGLIPIGFLAYFVLVFLKRLFVPY